jgi:ADP-ribose pyrophosphatase YjhB (NUDIX family)
MGRVTRYQGAVVRDDHLLLIKHHLRGRDHWLIPGGGQEDGESEAQCVRREIREETHLDVTVERLLLDEPTPPGSMYQRYKTYLCLPGPGEPSPGHEPEMEADQDFAIIQVGWFDLRDESDWNEEVLADPITYPLLQRVRAALGYSVDE